MPVEPVAGKATFKRTLQTNHQLGFDSDGLSTTYITVLTDPGGVIITAFPGMYHDLQHPPTTLIRADSCN